MEYSIPHTVVVTGTSMMEGPLLLSKRHRRYIRVACVARCDRTPLGLPSPSQQEKYLIKTVEQFFVQDDQGGFSEKLKVKTYYSYKVTMCKIIFAVYGQLPSKVAAPN